MQTDPTVIKAPALASALGVNLKTLHNWAVDGKLPSFRTLGGHLRFRRADVAAVLRAAGNPVPPEVEPPAQEPVPFIRVPLPDRIERVYVAGPSAERGRLHDVMHRGGIPEGVSITFDWLEALETGEVDDSVLAPRCLAGVVAADLVVALAPRDLLSGGAGNTTIGTWAELGAAAALRKPIILVAHPENGPIPFEVLCHRVRTDKAALRMLRERTGGGK